MLVLRSVACIFAFFSTTVFATAVEDNERLRFCYLLYSASVHDETSQTERREVSSSFRKSMCDISSSYESNTLDILYFGEDSEVDFGWGSQSETLDSFCSNESTYYFSNEHFEKFASLVNNRSQELFNDCLSGNAGGARLMGWNVDFDTADPNRFSINFEYTGEDTVGLPEGLVDNFNYSDGLSCFIRQPGLFHWLPWRSSYIRDVVVPRDGKFTVPPADGQLIRCQITSDDITVFDISFRPTPYLPQDGKRSVKIALEKPQPVPTACPFSELQLAQLAAVTSANDLQVIYAGGSGTTAFPSYNADIYSRSGLQSVVSTIPQVRQQDGATPIYAPTGKACMIDLQFPKQEEETDHYRLCTENLDPQRAKRVGISVRNGQPSSEGRDPVSFTLCDRRFRYVLSGGEQRVLDGVGHCAISAALAYSGATGCPEQN